MVFGSVDLGVRSRPAVDEPKRWVSYGVSMARVVGQADFEGQEQDIPLTFIMKTETLKNSIDVYLNSTVKNFGAASVTLDSGDDLGVAALGTSGSTVTLYYVGNSFRAEWISGVKWNITFTMRYYA